jgi:fido (protein-threonine AMPylation protein)
MFSQVWKWAGKYRQSVKTVGVAPYKIQLEMTNLEADIRFWGQKQSFDPIETSARFIIGLSGFILMKMAMGAMADLLETWC